MLLLPQSNNNNCISNRALMGKLSAPSENTRGEEGYESFFRRLDCIRVLIVVAAITLAVATFNLVVVMTNGVREASLYENMILWKKLLMGGGYYPGRSWNHKTFFEASNVGFDAKTIISKHLIFWFWWRTSNPSSPIADRILVLVPSPHAAL